MLNTVGEVGVFCSQLYKNLLNQTARLYNVILDLMQYVDCKVDSKTKYVTPPP